MRLLAFMGMALCAIGWSGLAAAQDAKQCDKPRQMECYKTCANVDKAKAEGAFVLYSTDPEQGQVKLLAAFNKLFPEIKTSYVRLQAGALYAKVLSERQAKSFLVDVMQISDMGYVLDFQKRGGYRQYLSPEMAACTTHLPVSTARIWVKMTCSLEAGVRPHDESLVVTTIRFAPAAANRRNRSGKMFSKQIGVPIFIPSTSKSRTSWPAATSRGTTRSCSTHPRRRRNGTYSPNGTGCILV